MTFQLPVQGIVFWPVGNGDSTTIVVDHSTIIQVDLNHLEVAKDEDDSRRPILNELIPLLPEVDGKKYLSLFVLTHPDEDHCRGFAELLKKTTIGELWLSPRVMSEFKSDLCDDAKAFKKEAERRVANAISTRGLSTTGDKVRLIGYSEEFVENYKDFPTTLIAVPGTTVNSVSGTDLSSKLSIFIHCPFKKNMDGERNDTSIALQVILKQGRISGRVMLLGDLAYPSIKEIFGKGEDKCKAWDVLLAPHHCSKSAMYWADEEDGEKTLRQDVIDAISASSSEKCYIVSSSMPIPGSNKEGDNPPHRKAKNRYQEIEGNSFLCTQEHPDVDTPEPIVFDMGAGGLVYREPDKPTPEKPKKSGDQGGGLGKTVTVVEGMRNAPTQRVGFGNE